MPFCLIFSLLLLTVFFFFFFLTPLHLFLLIPLCMLTNIQIRGQLYHRIGSLIPTVGKKPVFAQIYFYHGVSNSESALERRLDFIYDFLQPKEDSGVLPTRKPPTRRMQELDRQIVTTIHDFINNNNPYAVKYKSAAQQIQEADAPILGMKIVAERTSDPRLYNAPSAD